MSLRSVHIGRAVHHVDVQSYDGCGRLFLATWRGRERLIAPDPDESLTEALEAWLEEELEAEWLAGEGDDEGEGTKEGRHVEV